MTLYAEAAAAMRCTEEELADWSRRVRADAPNPHDNPEACRRIMRQLAKYRTGGGDADDAA